MNTINNSSLIIYQDVNGQIKLDVRFEDGTVWLNQRQIAELFGKSIKTINEHIQNIFQESELQPSQTIRNFQIVQTEGKKKVSRSIDFYNLDLIIAVGYRTKSSSGTRFRQWATTRLSEYIIKGFILDDERLKNPDLPFDYFEELSRRISDIRSSEKRFYKKIIDIYTLSIDYDSKSKLTTDFFTTVQNKLHFAITGCTAAELIYSRADSSKPNMGLTNFRGPTPRKSDIETAKNYLDEDELSALNNLAEQYLLFAEGQAQKRIPMRMQDWVDKLHGFLQLNDQNILQGVGKISAELAKERANEEYSKFHRRYLSDSMAQKSDFDRFLEENYDNDNKKK